MKLFIGIVLVLAFLVALIVFGAATELGHSGGATAENGLPCDDTTSDTPCPAPVSPLNAAADCADFEFNGSNLPDPMSAVCIGGSAECGEAPVGELENGWRNVECTPPPRPGSP